MEELLAPSHDSLERFLVRWHGQAPPEAAIPPSQLAALSLPAPLRRLYELAGGWAGVIVQNHLLPPDRLEEKDGKAVFYVENQGVCDWWTMLREDDGPVWVRDDGGLRECWFEEEEPLSRWLLQMVIFEGAMGAPYADTAVGVPVEGLPRALEGLKELPLGGWRWPVHPTRFYAGANALACVNPTEPGESALFDVLIGSKEPKKLRPVEGE